MKGQVKQAYFEKYDLIDSLRKNAMENYTRKLLQPRHLIEGQHSAPDLGLCHFFWEQNWCLNHTFQSMPV